MTLKCIGVFWALLIFASSSLQAFHLHADFPGEEDHMENTSVFDRGTGYFDLESYRVNETLKLDGERIEKPVVSVSEFMLRNRSYGEARVIDRKRIAVSMLCSALLPGLGELYLYMGSKKNSILARVPIFFAIEGYCWYGYKDNHDNGKDIKRDYMDFADTHWSEERFLEQHPCCDGYGRCPDWEFYNEICQGEFDYFLYIPRYLDEEEYYENLGKYNAFVYGWDDWDELNPTYWTPNRSYYWSLRDESNKYLQRGNNYLMLLIVNRVVSMIDAGWLAYRMSNGEVRERGWSLDLKPGRQSPFLMLSYRF